MKEYLSNIIKFPGNFKKIILLQLLLGISSGIWFLNMNYFFVEKGFDSGCIGKINAVSPFIAGVFSTYSGHLCDKLNLKKILILGIIAKWVSMLVTVFAPNIEFLILSRVIGGISEAMIIISSYPFAISLVEEKYKNTAYSLFFSSAMIALFVGNLIGGLHINANLSTNPYDTLMIISVIFCMFGNAIILFIPTYTKKQNTLHIGFYLPTNPSVIWNLIFEFVGYTQYFLASSMFNLIFRDVIGVKESLIGFILGSMVLMAGVVSFVVPWIVEKFGRKNVTGCFFILIILSYILMSFTRGKAFTIFAILTTLLSLTIVPLVEGAMLQKIPEDERGRFSGVKNLINSIATGLGIFMAGEFLNFRTSGLSILYVTVSVLAGMQLLIYKYKFSSYLEEEMLEKPLCASEG